MPDVEERERVRAYPEDHVGHEGPLYLTERKVWTRDELAAKNEPELLERNELQGFAFTVHEYLWESMTVGTIAEIGARGRRIDGQ